MKLVFLGTPQFAVPTLEAIVEAGHQVVCTYTQPDRPKGRGQALALSPVKEAALSLGIEVRQPDRIRQMATFLHAFSHRQLIDLPPIGAEYFINSVTTPNRFFHSDTPMQPRRTRSARRF